MKALPRRTRTCMGQRPSETSSMTCSAVTHPWPWPTATTQPPSTPTPNWAWTSSCSPDRRAAWASDNTRAGCSPATPKTTISSWRTPPGGKRQTAGRRNRYVYEGRCVNVKRKPDGKLFTTFNRPPLTPEFTFRHFCLAAAEELLTIARRIG